MRSMFIGVMLFSLVLVAPACGSVVSGMDMPDSGTGGSGGEVMQSDGGSSGNAGSLGAAGNSPDAGPTYNYEQLIVGNWIGSGVGGYTQMLFLIDIANNSHNFKGTYSTGMTDIGSWQYFNNQIQTFTVNQNNYKITVITHDNHVSIPGYTQQ